MKSLKIGLFALAMLFFSTSAFAQEANVEKLTEAQKEQLKNIKQNAKAEIKNIRSSDLSKEEKKEAIKLVRDDVAASARNILSPAQYEKFERRMNRKMKRRRAKRNGR